MLLIVQFKGHVDVINCLLDNGADVNKLNDDGVSALVISFFGLYPVSVFTDTSESLSSHLAYSSGCLFIFESVL